MIRLYNGVVRVDAPRPANTLRIARVFPRRTRATPTDTLAFIGGPSPHPPEVDEVHVSVTFRRDLAEAEKLVRGWSAIAPTTIGGPATGMAGGEFTPGMYLREGYTITSRGCPNHCWYCDVWRREGKVRELTIKPGWNVLDDNLLACSYGHIEKVFDMLADQPYRPEFTGGLEAARLTTWTARSLRELRPKQLFFAYDTPDDWEPLRHAVDLCWGSGFTVASHTIRCYVLCGWPKDTLDKAERRMHQVISLGVMPMAMAWRGADGKRDPSWRNFQHTWASPMMVASALGGSLLKRPQ
jgi:hypothetical protein